MSEEAGQQLAGANAAYSAGDYAGTVRQADAFLALHSRSGGAGEAYYLRGAARYNQAKARSGGDLEYLDRDLCQQAKSDLQQAIAKSNTSDLRGKAGLTLGHLSHDTDDIDLAERMYRLAIDAVGKDPVMGAEALYRLGCVLQRQGKWRDADVRFQKVMYEFPGGEPARAAAGRVNANAWTVQAGAFATRDNADRAAASLTGKDASLPARTVAILDGQPRYVVHVGRYVKYEDADTMRRRVRAFQSDAFVTVTK
ncbi:MAG: SPOR domain-containing protein [Phycisphaerae bacterium]|nr:SPOR domain-containing protein [Phycisphaerae bacterium]